jgi:hypothetical protein
VATLGAHQADAEENRADGHMEAMKAGCHIEG